MNQYNDNQTQYQKAPIDEFDIENTEVVIRDVVPPIEDQMDVKTLKTYRDKKPVDHVIGQTRIIAVINQTRSCSRRKR